MLARAKCSVRHRRGARREGGNSLTRGARRAPARFRAFLPGSGRRTPRVLQSWRRTALRRYCSADRLQRRMSFVPGAERPGGPPAAVPGARTARGAPDAMHRAPRVGSGPHAGARARAQARTSAESAAACRERRQGPSAHRGGLAAQAHEARRRRCAPGLWQCRRASPMPGTAVCVGGQGGGGGMPAGAK